MMVNEHGGNGPDPKSADEELRAAHDLGGQLSEVFEATEHEYLPWEKRVHALRELLARKGLLRVDELRRAIEGFGEQSHTELSYYEQWVKAMSQVMIEKGIIGSDEFAERLEMVRIERG